MKNLCKLLPASLFFAARETDSFVARPEANAHESKVCRQSVTLRQIEARVCKLSGKGKLLSGKCNKKQKRSSTNSSWREWFL